MNILCGQSYLQIDYIIIFMNPMSPYNRTYIHMSKVTTLPILFAHRGYSSRHCIHQCVFTAALIPRLCV